MVGDIQDRLNKITAMLHQSLETVQVHDGGDDFLVVEVNHAWMFRFPRHESARQALQCEIAFLQEFASRSPLPVPCYAFIGKDFVGYRRIEGTPLTRSLFATLDDATRRVVARQMGEFLSALHTFPLDRARAMGLTEGWGGWREKACQSFRANVAPLLSIQARTNAIACLEEFFALRGERVVVHGDFYPEDHVFLDDERRGLSGVIDFGDLTIEDAAADFTSVLQDFGAGFLQDIWTHYSGATDADMLHRIRVRIKARPLFDAPYALDYGFEERFKRRLLEIEAAFGPTGSG
jgi:aminoglycoside 2''-phosphotransferase